MTTPADELSLLRMALDALGNAVRRETLERDRARLETSLQQARRMETIGALASGIAHNFNNIVGAILGYTEMAEAQVVTGSRPAHNLAEIRRAGEQARNLVDQILAFGRRRDIRRQPVSVKALIAETCSLLHASLPSGIELVVRGSGRVRGHLRRARADPAGDAQSLQQRRPGDGWQGAHRGRGGDLQTSPRAWRSATAIWPRAAMCGYRSAMPDAAWTKPSSSGSSSPSSPRASADMGWGWRRCARSCASMAGQ